MDKEIWEQSIYPDYEVSSHGRVKSLKNKKPLILKPRLTSHGTYALNLRHEYQTMTMTLAKFIASTFVPNPHGRKYIHFKDGNPMNVRADNLEWKSHMMMRQNKAAFINSTLCKK